MKALIVEDDATTRRLLSLSFRQWGLRVQTAATGEQAWQALSGPDRPHVAVLDWELPDIDGLALTRRLRSQSCDHRRAVYVIMLTRHGQQEHVVQAFKAGADDFMSKPFCAAELQGRLDVARRLLRNEMRVRLESARLARYGRQMHQLAEQRAEQLVHAERLATLGTLAAGVAHEINNPTTVISVSIQTLARIWPTLEAHLPAELPPGEAQRTLQLARQAMPEVCRDARDAVERIGRIVRQLVGFARQDGGPAVLCNLNDCVARAVQLTAKTLQQHLNVQQQLDPQLSLVLASPFEVEQVLINLLLNASHAVQRTAKPCIVVRTTFARTAQIIIEDNGEGLSDDVRRRMWDAFFTTRPVGSGTGLGLSISRMIAERHHGRLWAEDRAEGGARFILELPLPASEGLAA